MNKIKWLHISDLHLNRQEVETKRLRRMLPEYLKGIGAHCDYVFCTGDLRYAAENIFADQTKEQINTICEAVCVPIERLFIVPGNHDVNRNADGRSEAIRSVHCAQNHIGIYSPAVGEIPEDKMTIIQQGQTDFKQVIADIYSEVPERVSYYGNPSAPHFVIETDKLNILHVDSTITYMGDQERDLIVGTGFLMKALERLNPNKPTVLLTHYSYDFMDRSEQKEIVELLKDYHVQLWVAGHEHDHLIRKQADIFYEIQCGNLLLEKGAKACVILGEYDIDAAKGSIQVHAWFPQGGWAVYPFVSHQEEPSTYLFELKFPFLQEHSEHSSIFSCAELSLDVLRSEGSMFYRLALRENLMPDLECTGRCFMNKGEKLPILQVLEYLWEEKGKDNTNSCHSLLLGDGGMGKSTAMFTACKELLAKGQLAVFVSLQNLEGSGYGIKEFLQRTLYQDTTPTAWNSLYSLIAQRHDVPDLLVLIDGFNEICGETARGYISEIKEMCQYPGIQLMVSSRLDFLRDYGMQQLVMIHTEDLREEQIRPLFNEQTWQEIEGNRELQILLRNPMLTLLYAETCPVVEKNMEISYCDWRLPIMNATDLLHDYYLAQVVLQLERNQTNGQKVFDCMLIIRRVLPLIGYIAERNGWIQWKEETYEEMLPMIMGVLQKLMGCMSLQFKRIKRSFGLTRIKTLEEDELYALLVSELCLLRYRNGEMAFPHQVFRDYCAAEYLNQLLDDVSVIPEEWKSTQISMAVAGYLRNMRQDVWAQDGLCHQMLDSCRGQELQEGNYLIENVLTCWMLKDMQEPVGRNLSGLDLRNISLAKYLKNHFEGTICIESAKVSKRTFVTEQRHNKIVGMAFSHDSKTLAAISGNGYVSVTNVVTKSQMMVGRVPVKEGTRINIGFSSLDELIVTNGDQKYAWRTVSYEKEERIGEEIQILQIEHAQTHDVSALMEMLEDDEMLGECSSVSENAQLIAIGHKNGLIQVWDVKKRACIADLILGDSQVMTASFTKDGKTAAFCSGGRIVQIWSVHEQICTRTIHLPQRVRQVRFTNQEGMLECEFADGSYYELDLINGGLKEFPRTRRNTKTKQDLRKKLSNEKIQQIEMAANGNAIIMAEKSRKVWTWDQKLRRMSCCKGHRSEVKAVAICHSDPRFAASYSDERIPREKGMRSELVDQKVVRVRIVKTGQCQWRLPIRKRTITALQFFTTNRIMLAAFSTNGDIMLWELVNEQKWGKEIGHWRPINVVRGYESEPLECAVSAEDDMFISVYANGTVQVRPFDGGTERHFYTFPGVDLSVLQYNNIDASEEVKSVLKGYQHFSCFEEKNVD